MYRFQIYTLILAYKLMVKFFIQKHEEATESLCSLRVIWKSGLNCNFIFEYKPSIKIYTSILEYKWMVKFLYKKMKTQQKSLFSVSSGARIWHESLYSKTNDVWLSKERVQFDLELIDNDSYIEQISYFHQYLNYILHIMISSMI